MKPLLCELLDEKGERMGSLPLGAEVDAQTLRRAGSKLTIRCEVPIRGAACCWHPGVLSLQAQRLFWREQFAAGANCNFPFWALLSQDYRVCQAVALTDAMDDCCISAKMNQENGCYELTFDLAVSRETKPFQVWGDASLRSLPEVLAVYRPLITDDASVVYPLGAWEPVYCTWYAAHAALTEEYLRENARLARAFGFGTFIVDDGWCYDEMKRVSPATISTWYQDIGEWELSRKKLPQMKSVVEEAQALGLKYLFWVAPTMAGVRSRLYQKMTKPLTEVVEGTVHVSPEDAVIRNCVVKSFLRIFDEMGLDGLKIDFVDFIHPNVEKPCARGIHAMVKEIVDGIRARKPDSLVEFRQNYAIPQMHGLATAFRAGDAPFDYGTILERNVDVRLCMGDGVPVHADPAYFRFDESPVIVARHLFASLTGVPMFSMDLAKMNPEHGNILKNMLSFYRQWQRTLNLGHWEFRFAFGHTAWARTTLDGARVVFVRDAEMLPDAMKGAPARTAILNLASEAIDWPGAKAYTASGETLPDGVAAPGCYLLLEGKAGRA